MKINKTESKRKPETETPVTTTTIYAGNLSYKKSRRGLRSLFEQFGNVKDVEIVTDKKTGKNLGIAFIKMTDNKEAMNAIKTLDGQQIDGRAIKVSVAKDRFNPVSQKTPTAAKAKPTHISKKQRLQNSGLNLLFKNKK